MKITSSLVVTLKRETSLDIYRETKTSRIIIKETQEESKP
jgi:hypothetical protein